MQVTDAKSLPEQMMTKVYDAITRTNEDQVIWCHMVPPWVNAVV